MNYDRYFANSLSRLRDEHRYRNFVELERVAPFGMRRMARVTSLSRPAP